VTGRRADGLHLLDGLFAFVEVGDTVAAEPADELSLAVDGPFGAGLGAGPDNLVLRTAALMRPPGRGAALRLTKALPLASGIGGGSSDAAATVRLLARIWSLPVPPVDDLLRLGADVPVCLAARACRMRGVGEELTPLALPAIWLVLANPGIPVATATVYAGLSGRFGPPMPATPTCDDAEALVAFLAGQRNDLQPAAIDAAPVIEEVLAALTAQPGCRLARMSGSGATCFGIFASETQATAAAAAIRRGAPDWWAAAARAGAESRLRPGGQARADLSTDKSAKGRRPPSA
jgi:4-diphosphocytidyl-2-C-methyl-D-erythritol kinase